jgi:hypothetical protein
MRLQQVTEFVFHQVDVFSAQPLRGNALAVVVGADALTEAQMAAFANWTNLSETTFLLRPTDPRAGNARSVSCGSAAAKTFCRSPRRNCAAAGRSSLTFWRA